MKIWQKEKISKLIFDAMPAIFDRLQTLQSWQRGQLNSIARVFWAECNEKNELAIKAISINDDNYFLGFFPGISSVHFLNESDIEKITKIVKGNE